MDQLLPSSIASGSRNVLTGLTWPGVLALMFGGLAGPGFLRAAEDTLPKAEVILDKYVEATGGKSAYAKLRNRVTKGSLEFLPMGIKGPTILYQARPNKFYFLFESEGFGKLETGVAGELVWENQPMMGLQIKEGQERAATLRTAVFDNAVQWRKLFKKAECVGIETIDDRPCYRIIMTPNEGEPEAQYYDKESNLLVKTEMKLETAMGTIPVETIISDYKRVDGILIAHQARQRIAGMEMLFVKETIAHNVEIPAEKFKLPDEVQALLDKEKSKSEPSEAP